jgi:hypothetical protein
MGGREEGQVKGHWSRLAPLTGLVFVGLIVAAFAVSFNTPNSDASAQHVISFYKAHRHSVIASSFLIAYSVVFGLFFAAALRSHLRARSSSTGPIALGFAGMIVFGVGAATLAGLNNAVADVPGKIAPSAEQALNVISNDVFFAFLIGMGVFMFGNGLAIACTRVLPRWIGWIAVVIGIAAVTPIGFIAFFALLGWVVVVSVLMFVRERRPQPATAAIPA